MMSFSASYIAFGLLAFAAIFCAARRSAFCILRKKTIPADAAKAIGRILSGAFFIIYLFAAVILSATAFAPKPAELVGTLVPVPSAPTLANMEMPHGRIAAEQNRAARLLLIAETSQQQDAAAAERRQLFGQETSYIVSEGISGTEDSYLPPKGLATRKIAATDETSSDETKISVQEMVSSLGDFSSILADSKLVQPPAAMSFPAEQKLPASTVAAPAQPVSTESGNNIPSAAQQSAGRQQEVPVQPAAQNVSCSEIRMYMDATDEQIFHHAMKKEGGVATPWKGPSGSYVVIPAAIKGHCREYSIQSNIQGKPLRCYAACENSVNDSPRSVSEIPQKINDKAAILSSMSRTDHDALLKALNYHGPVSWRGLSGVFYTVFPMRLGSICREYTVQANIQGKIFQYLESNCQ